MLIDALQISGPYNIQDVSAVPNRVGLYVWYARFQVGEADWHSEYTDGDENASNRLMKAVRDHSLKFSRQVMEVQATSHFSTSWTGSLKEDPSVKWRTDTVLDSSKDGFAEKVGQAMRHDRTRSALISLLSAGFPMFSSPLYLGKATEQTLRARLKQHSNHFLEMWERYVHDRQFIERVLDPKDFAERALKLGFSPSDLFCMTVSFDGLRICGITDQEMSLLIDSAEWLLNRWATPLLGRR